MPNRPRGARLYLRRDRGIYIIRDGNRFHSTRTRNRSEAEAALARYIAEKGRPSGPATPDKVTIGEVLDIYGREHAPSVKDPARIAYAIDALAPFFGSLPVGSIKGEVCRRYGRMRKTRSGGPVKPGTIRKELGVLQAALNYCVSEGYLTVAPRVKLPAKPAPRDRWLSRDEAACLLRAAHRNSKARHLARFILVSLYTGTRSAATLGLRFMPHTGGGWVDTDAGRMYRRGVGVAETKKRQPPVPLPRPLLAHLRRWERNGARFVVEVNGQRVGSVKTAWRTALSEAGIEHCRPHDLRHTAVTWAMQNGIDKWAAVGFFGVTLDLLEGTYGHHHPDYLRSAVEAMERKR